jgi:hypothetical protein
VAIAVALSLAFLLPVGLAHRAVRGDGEAAAIPEPVAKYSFDQFFPQHKEN